MITPEHKEKLRIGRQKAQEKREKIRLADKERIEKIEKQYKEARARTPKQSEHQDNKEIKNHNLIVIKTKVNKSLQLSEEITIKDESTLSQAIDFLKKIKETGKIIKEKKELITKPLNEGLRNARDMFRPIEDNYFIAEKNVKAKILEWNNEQERIRRQKEEKLAKRVDKGTMKMETAVKKIEQMPEVSNKGQAGKVSFKTIRRVVVMDENVLPRKYLIPDMVKIRKYAFSGAKIEGVKVVEEKILASL